MSLVLGTSNLTVPLNFGAYTNGSFTSPTPLALEFTDPKRYAQFFAYGGGDSYAYGSLVVTSTSTSSSTKTTSSSSIDCFFCVPVVTRTTTTSTPTPTENITPNPSAYQNGRVGGGIRDYIYGSSRWGSGVFIPSNGTLGNASWTPSEYPPQSSWPKPYGFWPIYWGEGVPNEYKDSFVYKSSRFRPGGAQNLILASTAGIPSYRPQWYIIGDAYTIEGLNSILSLPMKKGGCGMYDENPIYTFDPLQISPNGTRTLIPADGGPLPRQNFTISPESAVQYYRGSSVVLGTPPYVNAYALNHNKNTSYWGITPWNITDLFPSFFNFSDPVYEGVDIAERYDIEISFLKCLNTTIAGAIPIIDPNYTPPVVPESSSPGKKVPGQWIGLGIGLGFALLILGFCCARRLATGFDSIIEKLFPGWHRRRRLAGHRGGPRVVFPHGEILPDYSREPIDTPSLSCPMTERDSEAQASAQTLLPHRRTDTRAEGDEELPPPYSPRVVSPITRR
ncbi:hypothetical protein CPB86DRAFT_783578 [Serendipita vermifera]|nr:hypothetical protein CPB86DRAFT_783578 [Serendipita vermifera]